MTSCTAPYIRMQMELACRTGGKGTRFDPSRWLEKLSVARSCCPLAKDPISESAAERKHIHDRSRVITCHAAQLQPAPIPRPADFFGVCLFVNTRLLLPCYWTLWQSAGWWTADRLLGPHKLRRGFENILNRKMLNLLDR